MNAELILLDTPILVSDEKPLETDKYWDSMQNTIREGTNNAVKGGYKKKIIAGIEGLPSIDYNGLEEELGIVDVEKLAVKVFPIKNERFYNKFDDGVVSGEWEEDVNENYRIGFVEGFEKAQSLNDKKFTLEDMKKAVIAGFEFIPVDPNSYDEDAEEILRSLQQPKTVTVEIETENYDYLEEWDDVKEEPYETFRIRPKITNNTIKIIKTL